MLAKLASAAIKVVMKGAAKLGALLSKAKAILVGLVPFVEPIVVLINKMVVDPLLNNLLRGLRRVAVVLAVRLFTEDSTNQAAFILAWDQLAAAFRERYTNTQLKYSLAPRQFFSLPCARR